MWCCTHPELMWYPTWETEVIWHIHAETIPWEHPDSAYKVQETWFSFAERALGQIKGSVVKSKVTIANPWVFFKGLVVLVLIFHSLILKLIFVAWNRAPHSFSFELVSLPTLSALPFSILLRINIHHLSFIAEETIVSPLNEWILYLHWNPVENGYVSSILLIYVTMLIPE